MTCLQKFMSDYNKVTSDILADFKQSHTFFYITMRDVLNT